ncbi:MAG: FtsX-like permease family protein [Bacteroidales bacterium]|nr:FtsX-like permease family protein [Bacteroidales bacterium]
MNTLPFVIAKRYLLAKKSQNIINVISMISSLGIMVGTAALLIVLSVFNGLNVFVGSLFGSFDPDLKVEPLSGKVFEADSAYVKLITDIEGVDNATCILCDNALLSYQKRQMPAMVMGVDSLFKKVIAIDDIVFDGKYSVGMYGLDFCMLGAILADQLGAHSTAYASKMTIYTPKRTGKINMAMPEKSFVQEEATVCGSFAVQQVDYDSNYAIISIEQARDLFCYSANEVSAIGIRVAEGYDIDKVKEKIKGVLGENVAVNDKWEQHKSFFKMMQVEKFMAFLILTFIIIIAAFNIIGSLSMLIFEKKESISVLKSMGASRQLITRIFLFEGWLVSLGGVVIGLILGIILVLIQQHFGIIGFANSEDYIISAYPVQFQWLDALIVFVTVSIVGILAACYPVHSIVGRYYSQMLSDN